MFSVLVTIASTNACRRDLRDRALDAGEIRMITPRWAIGLVALAECTGSAQAVAPRRATFDDCERHRYVEPAADTRQITVAFADKTTRFEVDWACVTIDDAGTVLAGARSPTVSTREMSDVVRITRGRHRMRVHVVGHDPLFPADMLDVASSYVVELRDPAPWIHHAPLTVTATLRDANDVTLREGPAGRNAIVRWTTTEDTDATASHFHSWRNEVP